jgi:hypothetical protein
VPVGSGPGCVHSSSASIIQMLEHIPQITGREAITRHGRCSMSCGLGSEAGGSRSPPSTPPSDGPVAASHAHFHVGYDAGAFCFIFFLAGF